MSKQSTAGNLGQLYLSLALLPLLTMAVVFATIAPLLLQLSQSSEELFRGDRLPFLPFPGDP
ncbi:MAG: hypothetical protein AAGG51_27995 [Cyanobacteria bacterium P01_G01_bin.54]